MAYEEDGEEDDFYFGVIPLHHPNCSDIPIEKVGKEEDDDN